MKHGMSDTVEYDVWQHMVYRCTNPKCKQYKHYGGRGIKVCDEWKQFINFYKDMGNKPDKSLTLDRIDVDKGYYKENCRWTDRRTQQSNRRKYKRTKNKYHGVKNCKYGYRAHINKYIGFYKTEKEAAIAFDKAMDKYFNDKSYTNKKIMEGVN